MSEFEYLAVFISIIFGISLTHVLAGAVRTVYARSVEHDHFVWTLYSFQLLILNWWTGFSWRDQQVWSFDLFMLIIVWATTHYLTAITLYPPIGIVGEQPFAQRRKWFFGAFIAIGVTDIAQTAVRGDVFSPWYYLPFVCHYIALAFAGILVQRPIFHRVLPWYFLASLVFWSFVVRKFLL